jgi:hypothetical protein
LREREGESECTHTQIRMRIVTRILTLVQKGETPLQVAGRQGHASIATLIRNEAKRREKEKAWEAARQRSDGGTGGGVSKAVQPKASSSWFKDAKKHCHKCGRASTKVHRPDVC